MIITSPSVFQPNKELELQVCSDSEFADWAEAVQVDFDDSIISYESLVEKFFDSHDHWLGSGKRQYMSCIFYHTEDQKSVALSALARRAMKRRVATLVEPATDFYEVRAHTLVILIVYLALTMHTGGGISSEVAAAAPLRMARRPGPARYPRPRGLASRGRPQRVCGGCRTAGRGPRRGGRLGGQPDTQPRRRVCPCHVCLTYWCWCHTSRPATTP
jgi:hypothetical protein